MTTVVRNIEQFRKFFSDDEAFRRFAEEFEGMFRGRVTAFFAGEKILGGVLGPDATKQLLYDQLRDTIVSRPQLLSEIAESLKSEDIVD